MTINPGDKVLVRTAFGDEVERRALSGVTQGLDFLIVWVCEEGEWTRAQASGADPVGVPWPAEAVQTLREVSA